MVLLDLSTLSPISGSPLAAGTEPDAAAVSPDGHWGAIVNGGGDGFYTPPAVVQGTIQLIDLTTTPPTILSPVDAGTFGVGIAPNGGPLGCGFSPDSATLYVVNGNDGTIDAVDVASNTIISGTGYPIPTSVANPGSGVGIGQNCVVTPDGRWLMVPILNGGNNVDFIDLSLSPPAVAYTVAVGTSPGVIQVSNDGVYALVGNGGDGTVACIDLTPLPSSAPVYNSGSAVALGSGALTYWVAFNNANDKAMGSDAGNLNCVVIDLTSAPTALSVLATIPVSGLPVAGCYSQDDSLYVAASLVGLGPTDPKNVVIIDTATNAVSSSISMTGVPAGIIVTPGSSSHFGQGTMIAFA